MNLLSETATISDSSMCEHKPDAESEMDSDPESFPILVRSMSTSRRHSWDVPLSPVDLGRRFSLDTTGMDSDVEREEERSSPPPSLSQSHSSVEEYLETDASRTSQPPTLGRTVYARSDILASDEKIHAEKVSRILETSKQAARAAGEENDSEEGLRTADGQCHVVKCRTSSGDRKESSSSVTWYEFLSNENEEDEDKAERSERGTKVKRTLSSLRNRMTGSFNKDKGKNREKEQQKEKGEKREREKEKEKEKTRRLSLISRTANGHQLIPGSFSSLATCSLCSKSLQRKHGLQCLNCAVNVHKSCKNLLPECSNSKNKTRDFAQKTSGTTQSHSLASREPCFNPPQTQSQAPSADGSSRSARCASGMTVPSRGPSTQPAASSSTQPLSHTSSSSSIAGEMDEVDAFRIKRFAEDAISLAPSTAESIIAEDVHYSNVRQELEGMAQDFEVESWSLAVEQQFLKKHSKDMIKRQDVIYELIQTEMHHVRTLKIMLRVYVHELRETLQLDERRLDCLFPRLDSLLNLHGHFLSRLKERRQEALELGSERNYAIDRVADILTDQFSGEYGERMKECYGAFCSRHTEAVSFYKEQLQSNKKFQSLIKKISHLSIVRRLGISECILLVTQRITKYPVLVERLLQYTEAGTEEHKELARALDLIKDSIVQVDAQVSLYEKETRLKEIASKMEARSLGKIKDGRIFRKEDLTQGKRNLLYEGMVNWKAASGRLKDILAVLLTDVLLLLQEKDQRYVFSAVDSKPSVISLQKLIVREVAHEEKAMFLICASSNEPEMYEIHTSSKEDRNTWITQIRQAVESCPHTEERLFSEEEGTGRLQRFKEIQDRLTVKDAQITQTLTEKLQLFAELTESVPGVEDVSSRSRLLVRGDASDLQQGEVLLKGAITEVENLQNLLLRGASPHSGENQSPSSVFGMLPKRADTFGGYDSNLAILQKNGSVKKHSSGSGKSRDRSQRASSDPQLKEICASQELEETVDTFSPSWNTIRSNAVFPEAEFYERVLLLSQRLYSLQAIISQQDSQIELQRASLYTAERDRPGRPRGTNVLLEQEKQRNLEKQREELANFQRLQTQHRQEQARWERERKKQQQQAEVAEQRLHDREEECRRLEARLAEERQELERQRQTYQQDLERLRESTRAVEKEKERLEQQKKLKKHKTVPSTASLYSQETGQLPVSSSFNGELLLGNAAGESSGPTRSLIRSSMSLASADYLERPEVPPRRESSTAQPLKTEVPIHLISTTNQLHKQGGVQQQIPTKLALMKSKDKSSKVKSSHRTDSSASIDMKQMLPMKLSAREGENTLKARRSISPNQQPQPSLQLQSTDPPSFADSCPSEPSSIQTASLQRPQTQNLTPPYTVTDDTAKEDVIFF
ncbi:rho guanine nucleotide exchange factor 18 isoform X1 [Astyanax mexicanus]|uniref:rho guanine nucleotide exchange factor 18 isoform X1 n=1 Tax=Astyanax mexicanus TaxID=7994 RepID=UPI0020CB1D96|nr:rho guanine nucleotide exchange factor 18 isoform X1 [Astyanax mexicanus]